MALKDAMEELAAKAAVNAERAKQKRKQEEIASSVSPTGTLKP